MRPALLLVLIPGLAFAQAEPAPDDYVPPQNRGLPPELAHNEPEGPARLPQDNQKWRVAVAPRLAVRLGDAPPGLPQIGVGGGVQVARAIWPLGRTLRFGFGFDFAYDRFFREKKAPEFGTQYLSHASFAAVAIVDALVGREGRVRPYLGVGGGLSVAAYEDPPPQPGLKGVSEVAALGLVHLTLGLAVRVWESFEIGLHGEFDFTFSDTTVGTPPQHPFQPGLFALALDVGFRF